jgi:hypothetical protein
MRRGRHAVPNMTLRPSGSTSVTHHIIDAERRDAKAVQVDRNAPWFSILK